MTAETVVVGVETVDDVPGLVLSDEFESSDVRVELGATVMLISLDDIVVISLIEL